MILVTLFVIHFGVFGQNDFRNGFVIMLDSDTIQGQVDYRTGSKNFKSCIFKGQKGESEYFPDQISGFGYHNDKFYSSQIIEGAFVEVLVIGKISLYKSIDKFLINKNDTYFELEEVNEEIEIEGKVGTMDKGKWRGIITYLISDCLQNASELTSKIKLNEKSLTKLMVKYNKCQGIEFTEFKASKPWTQFDLGISIGVSKSKIYSDASGDIPYLDDSYTSIDPTLGVIVAMSSPRISERIAFQGELYFLKSSFSSLALVEEYSTRYYDTYIDLTTLSMPFSFKYSFLEKKYGFYLQGGLNYDFHFKSNTRVLSEEVNGNVVNTFSETSAFKVNNNQIGYWGGIGIRKSYKRFGGSIAIRYFQMSALNKGYEYTVNNNRISLNLILFNR